EQIDVPEGELGRAAREQADHEHGTDDQPRIAERVDRAVDVLLASDEVGDGGQEVAQRYEQRNERERGHEQERDEAEGSGHGGDAADLEGDRRDGGAEDDETGDDPHRRVPIPRHGKRNGTRCAGIGDAESPHYSPLASVHWPWVALPGIADESVD